MARYAVGDVHGRYSALVEVLDKAGFDSENDLLIVLGDVADGGEHTKECFDLLLELDNLVYILGNHDVWFLEWATGSGKHKDLNPLWWNQGGIWTSKSYGHSIHKVPKSHKELLKNAHWYYVLDDMLFVHGGYDPHKPLEEHDLQTLTWDRQIVDRARNGAKFKPFTKVFVGHTTVQGLMQDEDFTDPLIIGKLHCLDTGAGWTGRLTLMDIDSGEYWQSGLQAPKR